MGISAPMCLRFIQFQPVSVLRDTDRSNDLLLNVSYLLGTYSVLLTFQISCCRKSKNQMKARTLDAVFCSVVRMFLKHMKLNSLFYSLSYALSRTSVKNHDSIGGNERCNSISNPVGCSSHTQVIVCLRHSDNR